jgi:hypothetical protein
MQRMLAVAVGVLIASGTAAAAGTPARLDALARATLGKDFRIRFHLEKNARICGGEGDAYVGQVEMNKYQRAIGSDGAPTLKDRWVKVDKEYSIFVRDLAEPHPQLFDNDACME